MEDVVRAGEERRVRRELPDVVPVAGEIGVALDVGEVAAMAADEIVDDADRIAALEQQIDHVAADEAGAAGDDGNGLAAAHAALSVFSRRTLK